jgi:hypothetical protein
MAAAGEDFYRDTARAGYRGAYLRAVAAEVAGGALDLEALNDPALPDAEVEERLLALPGVGPYAAAHVMLTSLGRYSRLVLDSWTRPTYAKLRGRKASDKTIRPPLPALRAVRRTRVLADAHAQLGRRGNPLGACGSRSRRLRHRGASDAARAAAEIGAGSGELAEHLRRAGYDVVAIDPASETPRVEPVALDELEGPDESFDAAVAGGVTAPRRATDIDRASAWRRCCDLARCS